MALAVDARFVPRWQSLAGALLGALRAAGDRRPDEELVGLSGLAFRLNVGPEVALSGPTAWPWLEELGAVASRLGYDLDWIHAAPDDPRRAALRARAVALVRAALGRGAPALAWGVQLPEFGLLVGLDEERRELAVSGVLDGRGAPRTLALDELGAGDVPILLVASLTTAAPPPAPAPALRAALRAAVAHGRGRDARLGGHASGLDGYRAWRAALDAGRVDPAGLAYNAQVWAEARRAAPPFLRAAAGALDLPPLLRAAERYQAVADALGAVAARHPFPPRAGAPLTTPALAASLEELATAARAEEAGLEALEEALAHDARREAGARVRIAPLEALDAAFACLREVPLEGLEADAARCREALGPELGRAFQGRVAWEGARLVGHVYFAPLDRAPLGVVAEAGRFLLVYCAWVERRLRGRGVGARLLAAVCDEGFRAGYDGVLVRATELEVFNHHADYERLGFRELDRAGEVRLLHRAIASERCRARLARPAAPAAAPPGRVAVRVLHAHHCPLLDRTRRDAAAAARALGDAVAVEERLATREDAPLGGAGVTIGDAALAPLPAPPGALEEAIARTVARARR